MVNQQSATQLNFTDGTLSFDETLDQVAAGEGVSADVLYQDTVKAASRECKNLRGVGSKGGCFVAGTLVHTKDGPVSIEELRVGDWVLSQPDTKGEISYKRVINTFVFDNKEVSKISYSLLPSEEDNNLPEDIATDENHPYWLDKVETVVGTGNHPFWVQDVGWTAVDHLEEGHMLLLQDGRQVMAYEIYELWETDQPGLGWAGENYLETPGRLVDLRGAKPSIGPAETYFQGDLGAPQRARVYDIEVEENHTYFVGRLGVWVRNPGFPPTESASDAAAMAEERPPKFNRCERDSRHLKTTHDAQQSLKQPDPNRSFASDG
jgi:hypothetical protein